MSSSGLKSLLEKYLTGTLSEEDFKRLWNTLKDKETEADWLSAIEEAIHTKTQTGLSDEGKAAEALAKIKAKIFEEENRVQHSPRILRLYTNNKRIFAYAAAVLIVIISTVVYIQYSDVNNTQPQTAGIVKPQEDVEPGGERAVLTLSDGTTIVLDNATDGTIAQQGHMQVIKLPDGKIQYKAINSASNEEITFNTMSTPRGGQYQLILPDGSKVWLNAESSITYPTAFAGKERKVTIAGEVYFEVAKDKTKPFRVETGDAEIEVLGTHFNIKAYPGEGPSKTSLLEGSVKVSQQVLKPGQAFINGNIVPTDVDQDVAWKNGIFNFNNQNLSQVMMQLARWYDLELVYPAGIPQKEYGGEIGRNLKLAQVLKGLENSGVHFELIGKRVVITPETTK